MDANRQKQMSEMWKPRVQELDDTIVSSGETRYYERMQNEWTRIVEELGEPFSIDDFSQIEFTQRKFCKQLDRASAFRKLIAYLQKEKEYITEKERKQLNSDFEITQDGIKFNSKESEELFSRLVGNVRQKFLDNELTEDFQDEEYIRGLFYKLNERRLLESMVFGFNMTVKDVNFFLGEVFNNKGLDDNIPDEYLLSIVLESKPEENISRYQQFKEVKKYYAALEVDDVGENVDGNANVRGQWLFKGEYCTEETINPDLRKLLQRYDKRHIRINQLVNKFQDIPIYQYVLRYLFSRIDFSDLGIEPETLFQDIRQNKIGITGLGSKSDVVQEDFSVLVHSVDFQNGEASDSQEVFQNLVQRVGERFKERELPDKFCGGSYIQKLILNLNETKLLESMAFGLDMTVETVNLFLTKVLKRSELDCYNPEEYLLAIALTNRNYDDKNKYPQYVSLKNYYNAMEVNAEEGVIDPENTRSIFGGEDISFAENTELFRGEECTDESIHPKLKEMLKKHHLVRKKMHQAKNGKTFEFRTADREFFDWLERTQKLYREDIRRFKAAQKETEERKASRLSLQRRAASGILRIWYEPGRKIELKKGTRFYRLQDEEPVWFVLDADVTLPVCKHVSRILSVKSVTEGNGVQKNLIKSGTTLHVKGDCKGLFTAKAYSGLRYFRSETGKGKIEITCEPGTVIEKGTYFVYQEDGRTYEFECIEEATADRYISSDVEVYCRHFVDNILITDEGQYGNYLIQIGKRKEYGKYYIIAETGTINHMEFKVEGIIGVSNPKPLKYEPLQPVEEIESASQSDVSKEEQDKFLPFRQYLYGAYGADYSYEIFDEIDKRLFGKWFISTEITYSTINEEKFSKKSSKEKRNYILTLIFLWYVKRRDENAEYISQYLVFRNEVNETMQRCRMQRLYLGNPYDCLLAYLLAYDSPVDVLREIWAVVKNTKE